MGALPTAVFAIAALAAALLYCAAAEFLYSVSEVKALTNAQLGCAVFYGVIVSMWLGAEAAFYVARLQPRYDSIAEDEVDLVSDSGSEGKPATPSGELQGAPAGRPSSDERILFLRASHLPTLRICGEFVAIMGFIYLCDRTTLVGKGPKYVDPKAFWATNAVILLLALATVRGGGGDSDTAVYAHVKPLQRDQTEEWKGWMQIMFVLYHYFAEAEIYNAIRMCVGMGTHILSRGARDCGTLRGSEAHQRLDRAPHTLIPLTTLRPREALRVTRYIAAYVWMTGFGNFSYYYVKKDFTAVRFTQMMWRLNLCVAPHRPKRAPRRRLARPRLNAGVMMGMCWLRAYSTTAQVPTWAHEVSRCRPRLLPLASFVFFVCVTMNNEYMLYYICPMHTFFTWGNVVATARGARAHARPRYRRPFFSARASPSVASLRFRWPPLSKADELALTKKSPPPGAAWLSRRRLHPALRLQQV